MSIKSYTGSTIAIYPATDYIDKVYYIYPVFIGEGVELEKGI